MACEKNEVMTHVDDLMLRWRRGEDSLCIELDG